MFCIGRRRREITNLPKITSAFLNLTNACNLACRYCFVEQKPEYITLQTAKDAANFLARNAEGTKEIPSINFFGGEPMLMWEEIIVPLTNYIRDRYGVSFHLSMTSNGTLMDRTRAEFMVKNNVGLLFSMDGDKPTQDHNRPRRDGKSSYDVLKDKIPIILEYFPAVMFRSTVTPTTSGNMYLDMMFAEKMGFREFFTMPNCFEVWEETETLKSQLRLYSDHYIDCMLCGTKPIFFTQLEKFFRKIIWRNASIEEHKRRASPNCRACGKCGLGSGEYAGININGDVVACQELFSRCDGYFTIGNIYTEVRDEARNRLINEYDKAPAFGDDCETCPLDRICDGGCVANNYLLNGDIHKVPDIYCKWERMLFDEAVYIMTALGSAENETFRARWTHYVG